MRQADKGTATADAVVVGAGAIGLATAWRAARRGLRVAGARRRGARRAARPASRPGMLAPVTEADFGEQELIELNLAGARALARVRRASSRRRAGIGDRLPRDGHADASRSTATRPSCCSGCTTSSARWGSTPSGSPARECRRLEPGLAPRVAGGILAPARPSGLAARAGRARSRRALAAAGGELRRGRARAAAWRPGRTASRRCELEGGERLAARAVVLAAGAESGAPRGCPQAARVPVRPVKGQILRLRARTPVRRCRPRA